MRPVRSQPRPRYQANDRVEPPARSRRRQCSPISIMPEHEEDAGNVRGGRRPSWWRTRSSSAIRCFAMPSIGMKVSDRAPERCRRETCWGRSPPQAIGSIDPDVRGEKEELDCNQLRAGGPGRQCLRWPVNRQILYYAREAVDSRGGWDPVRAIECPRAPRESRRARPYHASDDQRGSAQCRAEQLRDRRCTIRDLLSAP